MKYIVPLRLIRLLIIVIIILSQINLKGKAAYADSTNVVWVSYYSNHSLCGKRKRCGGRKTRSGAVFNDRHMTAACPLEMQGKRVSLKNPSNGKVVEVLCTDTGDFLKYGRDFDIALKPAEMLGIVREGVVPLILLSVT